MAVTQRRRSVVNSARKNAGRRRKLSAKQIAAGFGGKRRQSAAKVTRKAKRKNRAVAKARPAHRPRTVARRRKAKANRKNVGKIILYSLSKEQPKVANTKRNKGRRRASSHTTKRRTKKNTGHRRRNTGRSNPGLGDLKGLLEQGIFITAGLVGSKYLTQAILQENNTGAMGYVGNAIAGLALSWFAYALTKNKTMASAILGGAAAQIVARAITENSLLGQYSSIVSGGLGDWQCAGMGNYTKQNAPLPYRMVDGLNSAQIANYQNYNSGNGMGCYGYAGDLYGWANAPGMAA